MEIRSPGASGHLVELLHREPRDAHGEGVKDHLGGREVYPGTKCRRGDDRFQFSPKKLPFHLAPLLRGETGVVGSILRAECLGDDMAPCPGMGEDDALAMEPPGRDMGVLLLAELLDGRDLLLVLEEHQVSLERDRAVVIPDEGGPELLCEELRHADSCREVEELGFWRYVLEPCDQPVEPMAAVRVFEHLDLIDHHGPDLVELGAGPDQVIGPFVGPHDNRRPGVPVPDRAVLGEVDPALPYHDPHIGNPAVPLLEPLVLLDGQRHKRDEEEELAPPFDQVLYPCHLTDEGLPARSR
ncbi:hypothetical protein ASZ90_015933 [hydrocarbon metagenome]|uniref:Uncharacterized protein n=1 Tax=hydrocarbon metagenome TaxID=938273 RepID=A0A0W8F0L7_9ZZZZ